MPDSRVRVCAITRPARSRMVSSSATAACSRPAAPSPWRCRWRRASTSTRVASPIMASARSASSPVIANTRSFACSLRSFRCAEIDRARRPAARRRSRTVVRDAAPAAWMRATSATISVIARTNSPESVGYATLASTTVVSARTLVQLHHLLPGGLDQQRPVQRLDHLGPQRAVILPSVDGCGTVVPSGIRQNRDQQIESATSRHNVSYPSR